MIPNIEVCRNMQGMNMQCDYAVNLVHFYVRVFKVAVSLPLFSAVDGGR